MMTVRDELYKADENELWEYSFPEVAADMKDIAAVEEKLEVTFTDDYRDFLLHANGWHNFYRSVTLFGTKEYVDTWAGWYTYALRRLKTELENNPSLYKKDEPLFPIAVSQHTDHFLFVLVLGGNRRGQVICLADGEIERYDTFTDFFEAMIDSNRDELEEVRENAQNIFDFEVDTVFDTAKSMVDMTYNKKSGGLRVDVSSHLGKIDGSTKKWMDIVSYGQCMLVIKDFDTLGEIADSIRGKKWLRIQGKKKTPFEDESIKQAVLKTLYRARDEHIGHFGDWGSWEV